MNLVNISAAVNSRRNACFLLMCCLLSFSVPVQSLAENRTFKGEGGDLSNAELWEAGGAQGVVTSIVDNIGTYYASDNLNFSVLSVNAKDVTFDFSQTPLRKVLFDGSVTEALTFHPTKSRTFFKGGEWAVAKNKTCNFYCGAGSGSKTHDHEVFLDNCVWTNLNRVYVGYSEARCKLTLDNNSCIYANQFFLMNKRQPGCELNIIGGSRMYLSDSANPFYSDFGNVLMDNCANSYCASHQAEMAEHLYEPAIERFTAHMLEKVNADDRTPLSAKVVSSLRDKVVAMPLEALRIKSPRTIAAFHAVLDEMSHLAEDFD